MTAVEWGIVAVGWAVAAWAPVMPKRQSLVDWLSHKLLTWWLGRRFKDEQDRLAFHQFMQLPKRERQALTKVVKRSLQDRAVYVDSMTPIEREAFSMWVARLTFNGWKPPANRAK